MEKFEVGQVWDVELDKNNGYYGKTARIVCIDAKRSDGVTGYALMTMKSGYEEHLHFDVKTGIIPYVGRFVKIHKEPRTKTVLWWSNIKGHTWITDFDYKRRRRRWRRLIDLCL